ncbi:hypothetical protein [Janthinobacterium sp. 13]|uniref:hypothetical protein n=1 Tax=Janthinobacterium sp. 13 TaxID=2035211 RepID=UPI000C584721|nr:hypothetical protein [Janthinobacterium sp. 13]PIF09602.1 hypothetical protein CLU94_1602 [Janthinobacterium sp. 13]
MNIHHNTKFKRGYFFASESIILFRGMKRENLHSMDQYWKTWIKHEEEVIAYKTSFKLNNFKIIVICFFEKDDGPIKYWDFGPENCMDGFQSEPEGKYTRRLRRWFLDEFGIKLPQSGAWGEIDACHDPHNRTTSVLCTYQ